MGFIGDLVKSATKGTASGPKRWQDFLEGKKEPVPGGTHGRSVSSGDTQTMRLLTALRSRSPGGWSEDRYEQTRHFVGINYVGIHRQNEMLSQGEFEVYKKDPKASGGKRKVTPDDPPEGDRQCRPYDLVKLLQNPNPEDNFGDLMSAWNLNMDTTGMALTWMVPNKLDYPMELYPIPTPLAIPQPVINPDYPQGFYRIQPVYPYGPFSSYPTPNATVGAAIPAQWMMRFKYVHPLLRYEGYSPQSALKFHLDEIEMIDKSRHYGMRRTFKPSVVLNMAGVEGGQSLPPSEIERVKAEIENAHFGPENVGNLFVSPPGGELSEFGSRPVDMDYQSGWDQLVSFTLGALGITKPAAGMIEDSNYSTLFATLKQLYWLTLDPKTSRIGNKLTKFLAPFFGDDLIVEVRCKRIDDHEIIFSKVDKLSTLKGMPKPVIRMALELMDLPVEDDLVEELSKKEEGGGPGMPGMGAPGQGQPGQKEESATMQPADADMETANEGMEAADGGPLAPPEVEKNRPTPGGLSQGALGPRKSLDRKALNRLRARYKQLTPPSVNGNGKHH
jgi:phage portal protein BeeE